MTDRELLELAAKAYWGDEIGDVVSICYSELDESIAFTHGENQDHNGHDRTLLWNPLTDDGDALRLAVRLKLEVAIHETESGVINGNLIGGIEKHGDDPYAATRRAIVRAAAEIGKSVVAPN
jgi:hypothetical protein